MSRTIRRCFAMAHPPTTATCRLPPITLQGSQRTLRHQWPRTGSATPIAASASTAALRRDTRHADHHDSRAAARHEPADTKPSFRPLYARWFLPFDQRSPSALLRHRLSGTGRDSLSAAMNVRRRADWSEDASRTRDRSAARSTGSTGSAAKANIPAAGWREYEGAKRQWEKDRLYGREGGAETLRMCPEAPASLLHARNRPRTDPDNTIQTERTA
jgi:hypothetical protein